MPAQAAGPGDDSDTGQSGDAPEKVVNLAEKRWLTKLLGKKPNYKKVIANAILALEEAPVFKGALRYNLFSLKLEIVKALPWDDKESFKPRAWESSDDGRFTVWLQKHGIEVNLSVATQAVQTVSSKHAYHPVREYLESLSWDGTERLAGWLSVYLGAENTPYTQAIGPRWLISAVARVMQPGPDCKADCCLVLEGIQGVGKSTALQVLASGKWFTDEVRAFGSKDAAMGLAGRWICEIAELSGMNETSVENCKAFLSRTIDRYRPPYGRYVTDNPRQCVFAASTNHSTFLRDETGDRRFWPVRCSRVDDVLLRQDRDQLWAEAYKLWKSGHVWWLDTAELRAMALGEQKDRFEEDPWQPKIERYLEKRTEITVENVLLDCMDMEPDQLGKSHRNRVSAILTHLNWTRKRARGGELRGKYVWEKPAETLKIGGP